MKHEFIGIKDVSQLTGISKSRLYKLTALGLIPHYKPTGKLLFKLQEIIEWVESSKNQ
jgi:excisionase family DNA binding protein